jgi:NAD+ kinase
VSTHRLGVIPHPRRDVTEAARLIASWARAHDAEAVARIEDDALLPEGIARVSEQELADTTDALVSLGGDGTMLGALRLVATRPVPVLGVNFGNLGFLTEVEPRDLPAALDRITAREVTLEPHSALVVTVGGDQLVAFNDVALARVPGAGFVHANLSVDGERYGYYRCDAIIVATPAGSTAYSYAAGGPVVSPAADGMLVTPASPMNGIGRPIFLSADEAVRLELAGDGHEPAFEIDGRVERHLAPASVLDITMRRNAGLVVRVDALTFRARNRVKLSLLDLPLLPDELRALEPGERRER